MSRLFCFGLGYVARRLGQHLKGWQISGTSRTPGNNYHYDGTQSIDATILDTYSHFLISIPPAGNVDSVLKNHESYFKYRTQPIDWIGYLSATSVYGDHNGEWVSEKSSTRPNSPRGKARLRCEQQWLDFAQNLNLPLVIFRLSSIYGPQRNALEKIGNGSVQIIDKPGCVFSRIHVDDICRALIASMHPLPSLSIYNIADDTPTDSATVTEYAYQLLGLTPPPRINYGDAELSPMAREFYQDNKRVSNQKLKHDLKLSLLYPTYKEGLTQCFFEMQGF